MVIRYFLVVFTIAHATSVAAESPSSRWPVRRLADVPEESPQVTPANSSDRPPQLVRTVSAETSIAVPAPIPDAIAYPAQEAAHDDAPEPFTLQGEPIRPPVPADGPPYDAAHQEATESLAPTAVQDTTTCRYCGENHPNANCHRTEKQEYSLPVSRWWHDRALPCLRASHWGYPEYFQERPFGSFVCDYLQMQSLNGLIEQQVLYEYDFGDADGEQAAVLNARGQAQLLKLTQRMLCTGYPLVIQRTDGDMELDEARRQSVLTELFKLDPSANTDSVILRRLRVTGLGGRGERDFPTPTGWNTTYENRLKQTFERGTERLLPEAGAGR